jgi:hypothetical protein
MFADLEIPPEEEGISEAQVPFEEGISADANPNDQQDQVSKQKKRKKSASKQLKDSGNVHGGCLCVIHIHSNHSCCGMYTALACPSIYCA